MNHFQSRAMCGVVALLAGICANNSAIPSLQAAEAKKPAGRGWTETLVPTNEPFSSTGRNRYWILEPGYQLVLEGKDGGAAVRLTITVLDETKRVADVETRVVEEREIVDGKLAEVSRNYLAFGTQSRHVYYFGEDVDEYDGGKVTHGGAWLAGVNGARFGILVPGEARVGARYYQEQAPGVAMDRAENVSVTEKLTTPAGKFTPCLKTKETSPLEPGADYKLYAPEVGLVQDGPLRLVKYGFINK